MLTRSDRLAMELALVRCRTLTAGRARLHGDAINVLRFGGDACAALLEAEQEAWVQTGESRLIRVRLALALRTLLRAGRGDFGRPTDWRHVGGGRIRSHGYEPMRPLWGLASSLEVSR